MERRIPHYELMEDLHAVDRNKVAALPGLIPGLGHIYKHHYLSGFGILIGGNIMVGFISVLMMLGTFGLSFFVPLLYIAAVMAAAYKLPDWCGRRHAESSTNAPEAPEEGETEQETP